MQFRFLGENLPQVVPCTFCCITSGSTHCLVVPDVVRWTRGLRWCQLNPSVKKFPINTLPSFWYLLMSAVLWDDEEQQSAGCSLVPSSLFGWNSHKHFGDADIHTVRTGKAGYMLDVSSRPSFRMESRCSGDPQSWQTSFILRNHEVKSVCLCDVFQSMAVTHLDAAVFLPQVPKESEDPVDVWRLPPSGCPLLLH